MITIAGMIYIVIFSAFGLKGNTESIHLIRQNATVGEEGVLKCSYPFSFEMESAVSYWKNESRVICYVKNSEAPDCVGLQHSIADGQMILTIPELKLSDSGRYTCSMFTKEKSVECNIDLVVKVGKRMNSNGIRLNTGPMFLLLSLAVVIWTFPLISL
ncbi:uncharacterized protein LOC144669245 [Cetorhinus maximus]